MVGLLSMFEELGLKLCAYFLGGLTQTFSLVDNSQSQNTTIFAKNDNSTKENIDHASKSRHSGPAKKKKNDVEKLLPEIVEISEDDVQNFIA